MVGGFFNKAVPFPSAHQLPKLVFLKDVNLAMQSKTDLRGTAFVSVVRLLPRGQHGMLSVVDSTGQISNIELGAKHMEHLM